MPTCPTCLTKYPDGTSKCDVDGVTLVPDATLAHVDRDLEAGTTVGEYSIEGKLGAGGFGTVYRAVHPLIGKRAAVKVLSREFSSNPQMVSRFIAEARAVNQIRHRNIIDIFSFGQLPDGRQYYIMELLEGTSFDAYLSTKKRLDLAEALPIFRGIARALDAAHAKGILHRDLKPENVFLVRDDGGFEPKLLDFGLVKLIGKAMNATDADSSGGHNTKTGTPMGTPFYMSPEQCRGVDDIDARADVYSFGALAFEVLTGEVPFRGSSTLDILMQHMTSPPPSASERCAAVPASLDGPLAQIMAKEPNSRPSHVGEAVDFLARAAGLPAESVRKVPLDSEAMTAAERAIAPTIMAGASGAPSAPSSPAPAQTFLGAERSVSPPRKSRAPLVAAAIALIVGASSVIALSLARSPTAPVPPTIASAAPVSSTVELQVDGIPAGTRVVINGSERGTSGGPFEVPRDSSARIELSAAGFKPKQVSVTPTEKMLLSVTLEPEAMAATSAPASAAPIETKPSSGPRPIPAPASSKIHKDLAEF